MRKKSFLDEAIAHAKDQERQRILELVKSQGEPWEVVVIEEIMEIINNEVF
jgi:ABC-type uncharacterized transport system ATPase subunit